MCKRHIALIKVFLIFQMQKNYVSTKVSISIALILSIAISTISSSNPDSNGLDSVPNNKEKLFLQNLDKSSNSLTVNAKQIYLSHGNITNQTIIESGINGTKVQVSYEGMGQFTGGGPKVTEYWIYINSHRSDGVIQGEGNGRLVYTDNNNTSSKHDSVKMKGYGRGFIDLKGNIMFYPTVQLYNTPLNDYGSLAFLNKVIGIADWDVDNKLNTYNYTMWKLEFD
jgi:hypothetical protein